MSTAPPLPPELASRVVRYAELRPQRNAFLDKRTPGSEHEETFSVIGGGVIENQAERHVHIPRPHGFCMGGARMPPGCVNSQHSHDTAEVFLVHRGVFTMTYGPSLEDGEVEVFPGDVVSIPVHVFRGFRNSGRELGHLASVLGGDDPGRVTWAPYVFEHAREHGLYLLANGVLVDTVAGDVLPADAALHPPTTAADLHRFRRMTAAEMGEWCARDGGLAAAPDSPLAGDGVDECPVIGPANPAEGMPAAPIPAPHGFHVRRIRMAPGARIAAHARAEAEVIFVHRGSVTVVIDGVRVVLGRGDYFSLPVGRARGWVNDGGARNEIHVVRAGDAPAPPRWTGGSG